MMKLSDKLKKIMDHYDKKLDSCIDEVQAIWLCPMCEAWDDLLESSAFIDFMDTIKNIEKSHEKEDNEQDTQVSFILPPFIPQIPEKNDSLEAFEEKRARDYEAYHNGYTGEKEELDE